MRSILVTGSDTGVGKTWVGAQIVRALVARGDRVQFVKVIETGVEPGQSGDASFAGGASCLQPALTHSPDSGQNAASAPRAESLTLFTYRAALAPASAAKREGKMVEWEKVIAAARRLPLIEAEPGREAWRIYEGAGGIASPIDAAGRDWVDFAAAMAVERIVIVVPERLGAINHARLGAAHAARAGGEVGIWLNRMEAIPSEVAESIREILSGLGITLWDLSAVVDVEAAPRLRSGLRASLAFLPLKAAGLRFYWIVSVRLWPSETG